MRGNDTCFQLFCTFAALPSICAAMASIAPTVTWGINPGQGISIVENIPSPETATSADDMAGIIEALAYMKLPAGARAGQTLRLRGRGLPGHPPGDQLVLLRIVLPPDSPRSRQLFEQMKREVPFDPRATSGQ